MKFNIFLSIFIFTVSLFPQERSEIRQITNVDGDARNVSFPNDLYLDAQIFFEMHNNNYSNIYNLKYDWNNDQFNNLSLITNDSSLNINPLIFNKFLFFQTNKNGNWDIAYKIFEDSVWSETKFVANSFDDEVQPTLFSFGGFSNDDSVRVLYLKNNSVYLSTYRDSIFQTELIFEGNDSISYSQPTGISYYKTLINTPSTGVYIAAQKTTSKNAELVYKYKSEFGDLEDENLIIENNYLNNPKFISAEWSTRLLTYESNDENFNNIFLMYDWANSKEESRYKDSLEGDLSDLHLAKMFSITKKNPLIKLRDYYFNYPHTFKYMINDSMFISINKYLYLSQYQEYEDTLIYTKIKNTSIDLGAINDGFIYYTIWEDSVDGNIQLFANKAILNTTDVNDPEIPNKFYLYQNYPNPFNPNTTIKFYNPHDSYIKLKIYNSLGEEVIRLIDGFIRNGIHEINFNASNLSSGIYFYQIESEDLKLAKKMILLK
ncbi:MAG: T9SS type A sorting domain-containing protein [Ignavibacteriaceae bacterium]